MQTPWLTAVVLALLSMSTVLAEPEPTKPQPAKTDLFGDELPAGALARFGTLRQRVPFNTSHTAFRPDQRTIRAFMLGTFYEWDASDGRLLGTRRFESRCDKDFYFTQDLSRYVGIEGKHVRLIETDTGKVLYEWLAEGVAIGAVSANGERYVAWVDGRGGIWQRGKDRPVSLRDDVPGQLDQAVFSADGKMLLLCTWEGIACWNADTGARLWYVRMKQPFARGLFSPDGKTLAIKLPQPEPSSRRYIQWWDAATGVRRPDMAVLDLGNHVKLLAFSPDGRWLAYCEDGVKFADVRTGAERYSVPADYTLGGAFSPDSRSFVTTPRPILQRWDFVKGKALWPDTTVNGNRPCAGHGAAVGCE